MTPNQLKPMTPPSEIVLIEACRIVDDTMTTEIEKKRGLHRPYPKYLTDYNAAASLRDKAVERWGCESFGFALTEAMGDMARLGYTWYWDCRDIALAVYTLLEGEKR